MKVKDLKKWLRHLDSDCEVLGKIVVAWVDDDGEKCGVIFEGQPEKKLGG